MDKYKITDSELESGVVAAPNILNDTPQENKSVFDRLPRLIATKVNGFIDAVISKFADYYNKNEIDGKENVLNEAINTKANADDVYKKTETYSKNETEQRINEKVTELGAGDMAKAVYDTDGDGVVDKAETAETAENAETSQNVRGYWLSKTDANGNPTEELYAHWYEDSETGEVVGSGDAEESKYTLVHEVTTTEELWNFTQDIDNAKKIYIEMRVPIGSTDSTGSIKFSEEIPIVYFDKMVSSTQDNLNRATIYIENGMALVKDTSTMPGYASNAYVNWGGARGYTKAGGGLFMDSITKIIITPASTALPVGTNIKIYEVK